MILWILLMIFLPPLALHPPVVITQFETLAACQEERDRVGFEMAAAYENEADFRIECRFRARVI